MSVALLYWILSPALPHLVGPCLWSLCVKAQLLWWWTLIISEKDKKLKVSNESSVTPETTICRMSCEKIFSLQPAVPMEINPDWSTAGLNLNNFFKKVRRQKEIFQVQSQHLELIISTKENMHNYCLQIIIFSVQENLLWHQWTTLC